MTMNASNCEDLSTKTKQRVSHPTKASSPSNNISSSHVSVASVGLDEFLPVKERRKRKRADTLELDPDIIETPPRSSSSCLPRSLSSVPKFTPKSTSSTLKRSSSTSNLSPSHRVKKLRRTALLSSHSRATTPNSQPFDTSAQFRLYICRSPPHAPTTFLDSFRLNDMNAGARVIKKGGKTTGTGSGGYDAIEAAPGDTLERNSPSPTSALLSPAFVLPTPSPTFIANTDRAGPYVRAPLAFAPVLTPRYLELRRSIMQTSPSPSSVKSSSLSVSIRDANK